MTVLSKLEYHILGMDRKENIEEKIPIEESILILLNSMIKEKKGIKSIVIYEDKEQDEILIKVRGGGVTDVFNIDYSQNLNYNKVLQALISIATEVKISLVKNGIKDEKRIDLRNINKDKVVEIKEREAKKVKDDEGINIVFEKNNLVVNGKGLLNSKKRRDISELIKEAFREEIYENNTAIELFEYELESECIDGSIVNEEECIINNNTSVLLYKMNKEKNGFEVLINGIKINNKYINSPINWRREPLRRDGYTFTKLFISLRLERNNFDLNNYKMINEIIEIQVEDILKIIRNNSESFINPKVNINLDYDRNKMKEIMNDLKLGHTTEVVRNLLEGYYENIKNNN